MDVIARTEENAPPQIRFVGGVAMSLWMTGANATDCVIVAKIVADRNQLQGAVEALERIAGGTSWAVEADAEPLGRVEMARIARDALDQLGGQ